MIGMIIYGLVNSAVFVLMAIGFSLTFGISGIANFAYGAFYITGAYVCWHLFNSLGLYYPIAIALAVLASGLLGTLVYRYLLFRIRGISLSEVIATFGLGIGMLELYRSIGLTGHSYKLSVFVEGAVEVFGVYVDYQRLIILGLGVFLLILLWAFTHHTRIGLAFRGIAQDEQTALCFGIETENISVLSFAIGSALAGLAAITIMPLSLLAVEEGGNVLILVLAVGIVGGLESTLGVVVASLIFGFSQIIMATYFSPHYSMIVTLAAIVVILAVKPSGLFGKFKELEERV
ncbi:MAG: branched-chain amino acid ABC transporter permease [Desulfatiglans sp.]|jgi:branched-chain amino acid transport system permease protein|nr:branched-chain amino acid ABC transporter permease [Thermodesulfobacteriota bacterium]MEE4354633.1 branched-chain amino acid ABC transporter permease [Desulfatiglans sp.]